MQRVLRARQTAKLQEIRAALVASGFVSLTKQTEALGLPRSTTYSVLMASHKASGLSAAVLKRMLESRKLPASVRTKLLEYVEEKIAGGYGHSPKQVLLFAKRLTEHPAEGVRGRRPLSSWPLTTHMPKANLR